MDTLLKLLIQFLPERIEMIGNLYDVKSMLKDLGLSYEVIHACKYDCMLFWKENESLDKCPICGESQYKYCSQGISVQQKV